jgi:hypothetical protein
LSSCTCTRRRVPRFPSHLGQIQASLHAACKRRVSIRERETCEPIERKSLVISSRHSLNLKFIITKIRPQIDAGTRFTEINSINFILYSFLLRYSFYETIKFCDVPHSESIFYGIFYVSRVYIFILCLKLQLSLYIGTCKKKKKEKKRKGYHKLHRPAMQLQLDDDIDRTRSESRSFAISTRKRKKKRKERNVP